MALQLRLIFNSLRLKKNNLMVSSYRQSFAFGSFGISLTPSSKGGAGLLVGLFNAPLAPRASTMKRYTFGFDATLIPLKNSSCSLPLLKKLPLSPFVGVTATSSVGAWASKFSSPGWFRRKFLEKKVFRGTLKSHSYPLFSASTSRLWLNVFSPLSLLLGLCSTQFPWFYLSVFNPGFFFYKSLEVLAAFPDNKLFPSQDQTKLVHLHQFFFNSSRLTYQGDLSTFTPEDLTYQVFIKRAVYSSYANFAPYPRLYSFNFLGDGNLPLFYFFFSLMSLGVWILMAVPKHKRYKRSPNLILNSLFSVAKRTLCPSVLLFSRSSKFQNQFASVNLGVDPIEAETSHFLICAPVNRQVRVSLNLAEFLVDTTWAGLFSDMTPWDFMALKKVSFSNLAYPYCPHPFFPFALYLSPWKLCGAFYKFFIAKLNLPLASPLQENSILALTRSGDFFKGFYARQANELDPYAPFSRLFLAILAYWSQYFSIYAGERVFFKPAPQFKSFGHFWRLIWNYLQLNSCLFLTRAFFSLTVETLSEDFFLDSYSVAPNLRPEDFIFFLSYSNGVAFTIPSHATPLERSWVSNNYLNTLDGSGLPLLLPSCLSHSNPHPTPICSFGFLIPSYL